MDWKWTFKRTDSSFCIKSFMSSVRSTSDFHTEFEICRSNRYPVNKNLRMEGSMVRNPVTQVRPLTSKTVFQLFSLYRTRNVRTKYDHLKTNSFTYFFYDSQTGVLFPNSPSLLHFTSTLKYLLHFIQHKTWSTNGTSVFILIHFFRAYTLLINYSRVCLRMS